MGFYWIAFTLIWITFYQRELTSAASLRSESLEFSPDAIDITKSHTEQNNPVEKSNYYLKNHGNQKHRNRFPYERRNRQIYTSKTFFGRNQQIELPRNDWINKKNTDIAPLRIKTARYMYPVDTRELAPNEYDNIASNHEHIPHFNHQMPTVPQHNKRDGASGVHGLNPNYNSNFGNAARAGYGLNSEHDPNAGYEQNPQYKINAKYNPRPEQDVNVGFGQVPTYQVKSGYPEYYGHAGHGQDSGYNSNAGHGQDSGYNSNAGHGQDSGYNSNAGLEQDSGYNSNAGHGQDSGYNSNAGHGQDSGYNSNAGHGQDSGYNSNAGHGQDSGYNSNAGHGQDSGYNSNAGHGQDSGYNSNAGHGQDSGYNSNAGHGQDSEYNSNAGHGQDSVYNNNAGRAQDLGYGPNVEYRQVLGYGTNVESGQVLEHDINADNRQNPIPDTNVVNGQDSRNANTGHGQDPGYVNHAQQGQDPGYVNHAQQGQDHGYNDITGHKQTYEYPTDAENYHNSEQNVNAGYGSNAKAGYESKMEYDAATHGFGITNDESKNKIKSEKVYLNNEEFKHEDDKKEVLQKQEEKKTIDHNFENKESKDAQKYVLNNDDHIKIINMYNQLLLAEKRKESLLNKNTETSSTASNSDFISDENLKKDELLRHLPEENTFKQWPSESASNEVPKTTFLEELEGSGNIESFDEHIPTSDQESSKSGRILDIFSRANDSNQCVTPKNESGHCRGITECPLIETTENFSTFLQYMCFQKSRLVGICCPDNPVIEISEPLDENSTEQVKADIQQPSEGCGLGTNTRIVGGTMSIPHEFSWMVALLRRGRFYCGGVIINNWYILTAAHCVLGIKVGDLKVRLGEFDFQKTNDHQRDIPVSEIKRHALFATLTFQHDIAVLKLKQKIEYTKFIGSICLPNKDEGDFTARNATVVGWGTVSFGGAASPILRKVTVPVWDNKQCDRTYIFERINDAFMCAGSPENGEDACQGDSGGPLMTMNDEGRWSVIGIVSWGRRCGDPTYPGVYTRVTSYVDWIAENAQ